MQRLLLGLCLLVAHVLANSDEGPTDPNFKPNDGELDSPVNPMETPKGNYHIIDHDGVTVLNRDTFAHYVQPKELVMVEFYAPWCGHCKKLEPEYAKAAAVLKKQGIPLTKVDATKEGELAKEHMVQGFPTLMVFRNGEKHEDYSGDRTADAIVEYMNKLNDPNWKPPPSAVVTLTADNFTKFVKHEKLSLAMFYAPWCKHCKQVAPEYEGAASELKEWGIPLIRVDGTREKELADQYGIGGWPAFKMFRKGRVYDYNGPREKQNIIDFMKDQAKPPSEEKNHMLGITNNMDRTEVTVIGFFDGKSDMYDEYIVAANEMRGTFKFMHTFDPEIATSFKIPQETVAVFMPEIFWTDYENKTYTLTKKSATYKEIITFIRTNSLPLVGQRTKKNDFKYSERPLIVVYYDVNYDHQYVKDTQYVRNKVVEIAKNFVNSNLKFAICNEEEYADEIKKLGFEDSGEDVNVGCYTEKQKFRMKPTDEFEPEDLGEFIEELRTGKLMPYMKSLPVPKTQEGPVLKIVADNYDTEIHKVKKDAVLFFHAPWCGHCKEFDTVFKKIAKKMMKNNENIVFGKLDATTNDIPYMFPPLKGYPAIFFLSAYEKFDPIQYQGDRTYKSVKDWINRHSSIFLTEEERTGQAVDDEEEIESFTAENFDADVNNMMMAEAPANESKKDEL